MSLEVGDKFIINWKDNIYSNIKPCIKPNKEFIVKKFSKSGISVYFDDNRTNKKGCRCFVCSNKNIEKCIGISWIMITQKKLSLDRNNKLKRLGI